jgi:CDGSH-type Zn-finger protein
MADAEITILRHGPLHVTGDFSLRDARGNEIECDEEIYLCRCGESEDKPFCDGTHKECGFQSDIRADD